MAAVDFLSVQGNVDAEKIGIIGICGWGGMAINTAALDTRIKATVASTMYDTVTVPFCAIFALLTLITVTPLSSVVELSSVTSKYTGVVSSTYPKGASTSTR